jgi:hypothetical protein
MRIKSNPVRPTEQAYALLLTLVFMAISLMLLASVGQWASSESTLTARNNAYNSAVGAAEAATEVVIAQTSRDFLHQALSANTSTYASVLPGNYVPDGWPADYQFSDGLGNKNQTDIRCKGWQQWTNLDSEFVGLYGMITTYEITSNARRLTGSCPVAAGVRQSIQFTSVPIFQYAIFYTLDLEINPGPPMIVTGKTHGNADVYLAPQDTLEFVDSVSVVGNIYFNRSTNDATGGSKTAPIFDSSYGQSSSMTLPVGTDNNPTNIVQILDPPPFGEDPSSALGRERFYNKSDLIITTTNNSVTVQFNDYEDGSKFTVIPTNSPSGNGNSGYSFVQTNALFYDPREGKQVMGTDIDIAALTNWLAGSGFSLNLLAQAKMGHSINSIYVDDQRPALDKLPAVRVINGQYLPSSGMTIATPDPLYIKGNFNAPDLTVGSTNTSMTAPASLVSDSITILSPQWDDSWNSSTPLSARGATDATVNAAFLSGIVQSVTVDDQAHYSGGVENFPRFLEDWSKSTLTYNGSMVVMFSSRYATNFWIAPGTYYNPPTRKWAFDQNFLSVNKLPPATPQVRKLQRGNWSVVAVSDN